MRGSNLSNIWVPKKGENGGEALLEEIIAENSPELIKNITSQIQKAQSVPDKKKPQ